MRRSYFAVLALVLVIVPPASAQDEARHHLSGALGFHTVNAPVGIRWWLSGQTVAIDAGVGIISEQRPVTIDGDTENESFLTFAIEGGVPVRIKSWDRVHFLVRPGIEFVSEQVAAGIEPNGDIDKESNTTLLIKGEFEFEVFIARNFSVSASHGIAIENFNPAGDGDSSTNFTTTGGEFTRVGFHAYLFGGEE